MPLTRPVVLAVLLAWLALPSPPALAQTSLEDAKRAYFEGRFEESIRDLEPLLSSLSEPESLREAAYFLGLNHLALGNEERGESYFRSAVRHDPGYRPSTELFNPDAVSRYEDIRSELVGRLVVESTPPGARILLGGKELGTTPYQGQVLEGDRILQVELAGYAPQERPVYVRPGEDTNVSVTLRSTGNGATGGEAVESAQTGGGEGGGISGKTIGILAGAGGGAAVALAAAGGGGGGGGTTSRGSVNPPPAATAAVYALSINPSPAQSELSSNPDFDWLVRFSVIVAESAGLGGNVDFINVVLRDALTGAQTSPVNFGAGDIIGLAGTNRVEASGRIEVPLGIVFNFSSGSSAGTALVDVQVTDDRGNRQRLSANVTFR